MSPVTASARRPRSGIILGRGRLRHVRESKGWNREQLAVAAGVSYDTIVSIEIGRTKPRPATLSAIVTALSCEPAELFDPL